MWRVIQAEGRKLSSRWVLRISLEESSSRGGASRKTATGCEHGQSFTGKKGCIRLKPELAQAMAVNQPKAPGRGQELKVSRYGYN